MILRLIQAQYVIKVLLYITYGGPYVRIILFPLMGKIAQFVGKVIVTQKHVGWSTSWNLGSFRPNG